MTAVLTEISDTSCWVEVTSFYKYRAATIWGHPDGWAPAEYEELEYEVLDLDGMPAPHLEEQLTDFGRRALLDELRTRINSQRDIGDY